MPDHFTFFFNNMMKSHLSKDVSSWSDITTCIIIDKPLMVYIISDGM